MKTFLRILAALVAVSAIVVAVIAYRDEIAAFIEKGVEKFKAICPNGEEEDCFADVDE